MRLATYQPICRDPEKQEPVQKKLAEYLGYTPIWCFPADTAEQFAFGGWFSSSAWPERIVALETDDYTRIDLVKWNHVMEKPDLTREEIASCFENVNPRYAEFLVKETALRHPVFDRELKDILPLLFKASQNNPGFHEYIRLSREYIQESMNESRNSLSTERSRMEAERALTHYTIGFILYHYMFRETILNLDAGSITPDSNSRTAVIWSSMEEKLTDMYANGNVTYEPFDEICSTFEQILLDRTEKTAKILHIGRNDKCPCGSGRKFKQCHGRKRSVRPEPSGTDPAAGQKKVNEYAKTV